MIIDLRSDTVTKPTQEMLEAMYNAKVGDNVFGEDESINTLEEYAAQLFGKESALFCPSGTMTNQIAIKAHTQPGDEVICDFNAHIYQYEGGGIAFNSGASVRCLNTKDGTFTSKDVAEHIHDPKDVHHPITRLISIENTNNRAGGTIWNFNDIEVLKSLCKENGFAFHLDGARLFNALVETSEKPEDYGRQFDSISICLSKGLGCPVGSLLIGDRDFILKGRRIQKLFGGMVRQGGYLAEAGLYALQHNITRLKQDHVHARSIESILKRCHYVKEVKPVQTNIIIFYVDDRIPVNQFLDKLKEKGVLAIDMGNKMVRFVTHLDVHTEMMDKLENILIHLY